MMQNIDMIVGWIAALCPIVGGVWLYLAQQMKKQPLNPEATPTETTNVVQGTPVGIDFEAAYIAELKGQITELKQELEECQAALRANGIPIP